VVLIAQPNLLSPEDKVDVEEQLPAKSVTPAPQEEGAEDREQVVHNTLVHLVQVSISDFILMHPSLLLLSYTINNPIFTVSEQLIHHHCIILSILMKFLINLSHNLINNLPF